MLNDTNVEQPNKPSANDGKIAKLVTVHGTGAGDVTSSGDKWWQLGSVFFKRPTEAFGPRLSSARGGMTYSKKMSKMLSPNLLNLNINAIIYAKSLLAHLESIAKKMPLKRYTRCGWC